MPTLDKSDVADGVAYSNKIKQEYDNNVPDIQMKLPKDIVDLGEGWSIVQILMVLIDVFKLSQNFILISSCIHPPGAIVVVSSL